MVRRHTFSKGSLLTRSGSLQVKMEKLEKLKLAMQHDEGKVRFTFRGQKRKLTIKFTRFARAF